MKKLTSIILVLTVALTLAVAPASAAAKPAKVKITKVTAAKTTVTLKWKKAKNAKKYQVYQLKGKKYKKIKTTGAKKFTVKKLAKGTTYKFKVRAINGKKKGKFSKVAKVVTGKDVVHSGISDPKKIKTVIGDTYTFKMPGSGNAVTVTVTSNEYDSDAGIIRINGKTSSGGTLMYDKGAYGDNEGVIWQFADKGAEKHISLTDFLEYKFGWIEFELKDSSTTIEFDSKDGEVCALEPHDMQGKQGTLSGPRKGSLDAKNYSLKGLYNGNIIFERYCSFK